MGIFGTGNANQTPKLHQLKVTQSVNGIVIPIGWGMVRVPLNLLWYGDFTSQKQSVGGKGLGKSGTQYDYHAAILGLLGQGPVTSIKNVYSQSGALAIKSASNPLVIDSNAVTNGVPSTDFSADAGVSMAKAYSVTANDYGSSGPVTYTGTQEVSMTLASSKDNLSSGQYYVDGNGTYYFSALDIGETVTINYSFSLYTLISTEDYNIPNTAPFAITVQYQTNFYKNVSVINILTGQALTQVGGSPGKGQYNPNGGNYLFNSGDAGLAVAISYEWKNSNDTSITPSSKLGFTLIEGTPGQEPWTYLTSKHASQALGYSTLAMIGAPYMDLGSSATMPDYNFECQFPLAFGGGIVDADVALVVQDFLKNPYYGAQFDGDIDESLMSTARAYWASNNFFASPLLDSARSAADQIGSLCEAGNVGVFWSEGKMKFVPYGDTTTIGNGYVYTPDTAPKVDLTDDDFIHGDNEDPVTISRKPWQDAYNDVKVQFENRLNNYNPDVVEEHDDYAIARYGLRAEGQKDYSFLKTQLAATFAANIRLQRNVYIRNQYKFKVSGLRYSMLEPMDLVTLTDASLGLNKTPVRLVELEENEDRELDCTAEEFPWGTATATIYKKQETNPASPPPALADPGDTGVIEIFEPSRRVATTLANSEFQIWMALTGGVNWGGCHVWVSIDGTSYSRLSTPQIGTSRGGELIVSLPLGADPDTADVAKIVINGQLTTVTESQADSYATLSKLGDEYLSYANATLMGSNWQASHAYAVGDLVYDGTNLQGCQTAGTSGATSPDWNGVLNGTTTDGGVTWTNLGGIAATSGLASSGYELTYLRRGVFASPNIGHAVGETFVRLDDKIYIYSYDPSLIGKTIYFKFTSFNLLQLEEQDLSAVKAYPWVVGGLSSANNMTFDLIPIGPNTWEGRVYSAAGGVGTSGQAALSNGSIITLPAYTQSTGFTLASTEYWCNYDPVGLVYQFYTNENDWMIDEEVKGYIRIGSAETGAAYRVQISLSPVLATIYGEQTRGVFQAQSGDQVYFTQTLTSFTINTHPKSLLPGDPHDSGNLARPPAHNLVNLSGNYAGDAILQGNGYQCWEGALNGFQVSMTGKLYIAGPCTINFTAYMQNGFLIAIGNGATAAPWAANNFNGITSTPVLGLAPLAGNNTRHGRYDDYASDPIAITFGAFGEYDFEICAAGGDDDIVEIVLLANGAPIPPLQ